MNTEEQLESEFKDFISNDDFPYYFYIHDSDGVFTFISDGITPMLGFTPEEFKSFYMNHVTANLLNREMIKYTQKCLQGIQQEPYKVEVYDKDYTPHYLYVFEKPVFEEGKVVAVRGVAKLLN